MHAEGSPENQLDYDTIAGVVEQAFAAWLQARCTGGSPAIDVQHVGPISCGVSEYNQRLGNANVVLFREDEWPYIGAANAIGLTITSFDADTGELWDADIEINATGSPISVGDPVKGEDLLSVLTHEAGHFLGLSHTQDQTATMRAEYDASAGTSFRTLAADDINGICTLYPPDRPTKSSSCEPRHGFSAECAVDQPSPEASGCSVAQGNDSVGERPWQSLGLSLLVALGVRRARRRKRC